MDDSSDSDSEYRLENSEHVDVADIYNFLPDHASSQSSFDSQEFKSPVGEVCQFDDLRTKPRSSESVIVAASSSSSLEFQSPRASVKCSSVSESSHEGSVHLVKLDDLTNFCQASDSEITPTRTGTTIVSEKVSSATGCDLPAFKVKDSCKFISQGIQCNVVTNSQETQCDIPLPRNTSSVASQSDVPYFHILISQEVQCDLPFTTSVGCQCDIMKPENTSLSCQSDEPFFHIQISQGVQCSYTDFNLSNALPVPQDRESVSKALQCDLDSEQLPVIMLPPLRNEVEIDSILSSSQLSSYIDDSCIHSNKTNKSLSSEENDPLKSTTEKFEDNSETSNQSKQGDNVTKRSCNSQKSGSEAPEIAPHSENTIVTSSQELSADELLLEMHDLNYKTKSQSENYSYLTSQPISVDCFSMELCSQFSVIENDTASTGEPEEQKTYKEKELDSTSPRVEKNGKLVHNILSREGKEIPCVVPTEDTTSSMPWFNSLAVQRESSPESLDNEELSGSKSLNSVSEDVSEQNRNVKKCGDTQRLLRSKKKYVCLSAVDSSSSESENDKQQSSSTSTPQTTKIKHKIDENDCKSLKERERGKKESSDSDYVTHRRKKKKRKKLSCSGEKQKNTSVIQQSVNRNAEHSPLFPPDERRIDLMPLSLRCERASSPESIDEDVCKELSMAQSSTRAQLVEKMLTADHNNLKSGAVHPTVSISSGSSIFQMRRKRRVVISDDEPVTENPSRSYERTSIPNRKPEENCSIGHFNSDLSNNEIAATKSLRLLHQSDQRIENNKQGSRSDDQISVASSYQSPSIEQRKRGVMKGCNREKSLVGHLVERRSGTPDSSIIHSCSSTRNMKNIVPYDSTDSDSDNTSKTNSSCIQKKNMAGDVLDVCSKSSRDSSVMHKRSVHCHRNSNIIRPGCSTPNKKNIELYDSTYSDLDNMSKTNSPAIQKKKMAGHVSDTCSKNSRDSSVVRKRSVHHQRSDVACVPNGQVTFSVQRLHPSNPGATSMTSHQNSNNKCQIICDSQPIIVESDSDNDSWFNFPKKQRAGRSKGAYTFDERQQILNYIIKKKKYACTSGVVLWQDMEKAKVCEDRTWQSMKEHFRKQILPRIELFSLDPSVKRKFISLRK